MSAVLAALPAALRDAYGNRRSFWFQVTVMAVNDVSWVIFWGFLFHRTSAIRGWKLDDVLTLFAIMLTVSGIGIGLLSNCRRVGQLSQEGGLDAALALPVDPLAFLLLRRVDTAMLGDLAFGPVLFVLVGHPTPARIVTYLFGCACGTIAVVSFLVTLGALTMLVGGSGEQADLGFHAILVLASYPIDLFGGATKLLLFTVVPAAFVTGLPASLMRSFDPAVAIATASASLLLAALAIGTFRLGLRRYASGSAWTRASP
jgi:ABC-2 type transport system permease protein